MSLVELKPFPQLHVPLTKLYKVSAGATFGRTGITLHYVIKAANREAFAEIQLSEMKPKAERKNDLWKDTCFECFVGIPGSEAYLEFNGAPNGDWNWYAFKKYREGMVPVSVPVASVPKQISRTISELELEFKWLIPISSVKPGFFSAGVSQIAVETVGLSVVLHTSRATTYWALEHHGVKPDFHLRESFTYDPIRN